VRTQRLVAVLAGALAAASIPTSTIASPGRPFSGAGVRPSGGYAYAGRQARRTGHGVRATITAVRSPEVVSGHVAGWVGVGGPGQGPDGQDAWIQVGLAALPGQGTALYAEVAKPGHRPELTVLEANVAVGAGRHVAVLEMSRRPAHWRAWVDGAPVTPPIYLPGSAKGWAPVATAESWDGGRVACNEFGFRFERLQIARGRGGSWVAFAPGPLFRDPAEQLTSLEHLVGRDYGFVAGSSCEVAG